MKAVVILAEGFEEIEAVTPIDLLRRAGCEVVVAGLGGLTVKGARGISLVCDTTLDQLAPDWDALVLPGGLPGSQNLASSPLVTQLLNQAIGRNAWVAAICAAPALVLGSQGFLRGRTFTGYPGTETKAVGATGRNEPVVVDGPFVTSQGVGTAGAFALTLIKLLVGADKAREVAKSVLLG